MNIHEKLMWLFAALTAGLFIAKYAFDVSTIGYWTLLPVVFLWFASWFAGRSRKSNNG